MSKEMIFTKPHGNRHERAVHRFRTLLCRIGVHDFDGWWLDRITSNRESRMCGHCCLSQMRRLSNYECISRCDDYEELPTGHSGENDGSV